MERRGIPTAVVCTEPFVPTAKMMARLQGKADYPFAVIKHPIGSLTPGELRQRAEEALPQVVRLLTQGR